MQGRGIVQAVLVIALCLAPLPALAVREGVVEAAPQVGIMLAQDELYADMGLIEETYRETALRLAPAAVAATVLLQGSPQDVALTHANAPVWYSPAVIGQDGSLRYDGEARQGIELIFERRSASVVRKIRAVFDLETEELVRLQQRYGLKAMPEGLHGGRVMDDATALRMAGISLEGFPGCDRIEMVLSGRSDGRYAVAHGKTAHGWRVEVMIDRAQRAVVTNEWIRDARSVSVEEMKNER